MDNLQPVTPVNVGTVAMVYIVLLTDVISGSCTVDVMATIL